jgi:hypothetical protein
MTMQSPSQLFNSMRLPQKQTEMIWKWVLWNSNKTFLKEQAMAGFGYGP